jgi:Uma2 family endonuclease
VQNPIRLGDRGEPQPDLTLLRPREDFYAGGAPTPPEILLVVEVADTSADIDRQVKVPHYARGGVAELWLVDLERDAVLVYRDPIGESYQHVQVFRRDDVISPGAFPGTGVPVASILG